MLSFQLFMGKVHFIIFYNFSKNKILTRAYSNWHHHSILVFVGLDCWAGSWVCLSVKFNWSIGFNYGNVKIGLRVVAVQLKVQLVLSKKSPHLNFGISINIINVILCPVKDFHLRLCQLTEVVSNSVRAAPSAWNWIFQKKVSAKCFSPVLCFHSTVSLSSSPAYFLGINFFICYLQATPTWASVNWVSSENVSIFAMTSYLGRQRE